MEPACCGYSRVWHCPKGPVEKEMGSTGIELELELGVGRLVVSWGTAAGAAGRHLRPRREGTKRQVSPKDWQRAQPVRLPSHLRCFSRQPKQATGAVRSIDGNKMLWERRYGFGSRSYMLDRKSDEGLWTGEPTRSYYAAY